MSAGDQRQLQSSSIEVVLNASPQAVFEAALAVASSVWNVAESDVVTTAPPLLLVHSVRLDGQVSCWLTWEVTPTDGEASVLRLVHDEADLRPGPAPELGEVIAVVNAHLVRTGSVAPPLPTGEVTP